MTDKEKTMKNILSMTLLALTLAMPLKPAQAGRMEKHGVMRGLDCRMKDTFLTRKTVDGYRVTFHVMKAQTGRQNGDQRNFMVKVERDGKVQRDLRVNAKVVFPDRSAASKMMMKMGDWYMAAYDMHRHGRYRLTVAFETRDGGRHVGGVFYPRR